MAVATSCLSWSARRVRSLSKDARDVNIRTLTSPTASGCTLLFAAHSVHLARHEYRSFGNFCGPSLYAGVQPWTFTCDTFYHIPHLTCWNTTQSQMLLLNTQPHDLLSPSWFEAFPCNVSNLLLYTLDSCLWMFLRIMRLEGGTYVAHFDAILATGSTLQTQHKGSAEAAPILRILLQRRATRA